MTEPTSTTSTSSSGPAGLGVMDSLSSECTPLKHKYDNCFNLWLQDYLSVSPSNHPSNSSSPSAKEENKWSSWSTSSRDRKDKGDEAGQRRQRNLILKETLEKDCGELFREYQKCVKKAVNEKSLAPLIADARSYNPFPFPRDRPSNGNNDKDNPPFPFAKAERGRDEDL